jgi:hypothetical protein
MRGMNLKVRRGVKLAGALLAVGVASPAVGQIIWETGCIAWDVVNGCTAMQTCWANSKTGEYGCTVATASPVATPAS